MEVVGRGRGQVSIRGGRTLKNAPDSMGGGQTTDTGGGLRVGIRNKCFWFKEGTGRLSAPDSMGGGGRIGE